MTRDEITLINLYGNDNRVDTIGKLEKLESELENDEVQLRNMVVPLIEGLKRIDDEQYKRVTQAMTIVWS